MRPIAPLLLFVCFCSCTEPSLNMYNEKQVRDVLHGRWESTHLEKGAGRMEVPKEMVSLPMKKVVVMMPEKRTV